MLAQHKTEGPTNRLLFSPDDGACWHSVELSEAITIDNIRCVVACELAGGLG